MLKFIVNGLMRAMLKYVRVCTPELHLKEACMLVHENKWRFIRNLGGTAEIIVFVLYMDKGFFYFNFTKMRGI